MRTKKFNNGEFITNSPNPVLFGVRFFPDDDDDELTIYDNDIGTENGAEIAHLDKDNPKVNFGEKGQRCHKGLYAFLPRGGSFYATWEN